MFWWVSQGYWINRELFFFWYFLISVKMILLSEDHAKWRHGQYSPVRYVTTRQKPNTHASIHASIRVRWITSSNVAPNPKPTPRLRTYMAKKESRNPKMAVAIQSTLGHVTAWRRTRQVRRKSHLSQKKTCSVKDPPG